MRACDVRSVDEALCRKGSVLRAAAAGTCTPSAVDAIVVALADVVGGATVLTSDPRDLRALSRHAVNEVRIGGG
ncbi:MAG: hypothetical protein M3Q48_10430 [Actinomycetota bacterium]|nr:hypothetical protein [Actinomycetota bacterium]